MPKQISYTLNNEELRQIEAAMRDDPRAEVVRRATAIHGLHLGHKPEVVAQMVKAGKSTVNTWHRQWRSGGVEGLADQPRSGRPPKANGTYQAALEAALGQSPADYGYTFAVWTLDRLGEHLEEVTGIRLSIGRLQVWLERLGYVYRRPKRDLRHRQDPQARAEMKMWLEEIKKTPLAEMSNSSLWMKQL
jgi:transposase